MVHIISQRDDVYRTMAELADLAGSYLAKPWCQEVEGHLRKAIAHARSLMREDAKRDLMEKSN
jgi:hypothetical protein